MRSRRRTRNHATDPRALAALPVQQFELNGRLYSFDPPTAIGAGALVVGLVVRPVIEAAQIMISALAIGIT